MLRISPTFSRKIILFALCLLLLSLMAGAFTPPLNVQLAADAQQLIAENCQTNGAIDPNETVTVSLSIKNAGTLDTTNLVATLQATGDVTNPSGPQNYGVIVAGSTVARSFTFTAGNVACGSTIVAKLQLQDGATNLGTITYTFQVGTPGAINTKTYTSGNLITSIPDVGSIDIPINVPDFGTITDVNVKVRLNHTFAGDLEISLVHPDGTVVILADNRGGANDNFGTGTNDCSGTPTIFDDSAADSIASGTAPFNSLFRPDALLSVLNGKTPNGTWKLRVSDTAALDVGTVGCVQLEIARQKYLCCGVTGAPEIAAAPPAVLIAESATPNNGVPDPEETVTMTFPLRNIGDGPTTNLVATLQATGGIAGPSGPQTYGVIQPTGMAVSLPFTFTFVGRGNCGDNVTATLHLQDGATDLGNVTYTIRLGGTTANTTSFSNTTPIIIPNGAPASTSGTANPYPSAITVSGVNGTVTKVTVELKAMSHTFPDDIDILLVGPQGEKLLLMSDAGGSLDLNNVNLTFDDTGMSLPDSTLITSGTYKPTNYSTGDTFATPAPVSPYSQLLSVFNNTNPNGEWHLFVTDDAGGDLGNINGGWTLNITVADPVCNTQTCSIPTPNEISVFAAPGDSGAIVNYPTPSFTGNCGVVTSSPASGSFFPIGTTVVNIVGTRGDNSMTTASFTVRVNPAITANTLKVDVGDPLICLSANGLIGVTATVSNINPVPVDASFTAALPTTLNGLAGAGVASINQAGLNVTASAVTWKGTVPANTTVIITYKTQLVAGTPLNMPICIDSEVTFNGGPKATVQACATLNCPAGPVNAAVSDQKSGALLVFPYYTSKAATQSDTRLTLSNVGEQVATLHLFFIDGVTCQQADFFLCLTPHGSFSFQASAYDGETTGWLLAIAVDAQGRPVQYNGLIGNAFVRDDEYVGNYGAESFQAHSPLLAALQPDTATLFFDGRSYDAIPSQFTVEVQSPVEVPGQRLVTVGLQGDLSQGQVRGAAQVGVGRVINGNESPLGSFTGWLQGACQAQAVISQASPRVPRGMSGLIPSGEVGTMQLNIGAGVGMLLTPKTSTWRGIRSLHKTGLTTATLTIPLLPPQC
jgi:subtilisin-like proprotein convertase family protein